jgi:hypothetical protein
LICRGLNDFIISHIMQIKILYQNNGIQENYNK